MVAKILDFQERESRFLVYPIHRTERETQRHYRVSHRAFTLAPDAEQRASNQPGGVDKVLLLLLFLLVVFASMNSPVAETRETEPLEIT